MVAGGHILANRFFEVAAIFFEAQVDGDGAGIDEAVEIGAVGAQAFEQVECAHGVDFEILAVVEGGHEGGGQVVDGVDAVDGPADVVEVAKVAGDGFDSGEGIQLVGAAGVAGVEEGADFVACGEETCDQIGADPACAAGYEDLHVGAFL